jgi:tetratricopeptide (TPR) repeat protein
VPALKAAVASDPKLASDPLYQTLYWEFDAYRGGAASDVKRGLRSVSGTLPPIAAYHAGAALLAVGAAKSALRRLEPLDRRRAARLPRVAPLVAAGAGPRGPGRLDLGGGGLRRRGRRRRPPPSASPSGSPTPAACSSSAASTRCWSWSRGRRGAASTTSTGRCCATSRGAPTSTPATRTGRWSCSWRPARSIRSPRPSSRSPTRPGRRSSALQRFDAAVVALREAIEVAPADHKAFAQHEAAVALLESESFDEAVPLLEEVLADPRYPHRGEALADLADVRLRAGDFEQAQADAERALELGAIAPACLVLGALAFEYYHLDEAVRWYEQARRRQPGGRSDLGRRPPAARRRARPARRRGGRAGPAPRHGRPRAHRPGQRVAPAARGHVARARGVLGGHDRVLN